MAGVIKSGQLHESSNSAQLAAFNWQDMRRKADVYLESIRQQATQILAQAKQQAVQIQQQAFESGRQAAAREAEKYADAQLERRLQTVLPALEKAVEAVHEAR